jgi:hypothetical protein
MLLHFLRLRCSRLCCCVVILVIGGEGQRVVCAKTAAARASIQTNSSTISGILRDASNGEVVIGISVIIARDSTLSSPHSILRGTRTNKFGFYSLVDVPEGSWFLIVRGVGYQTQVRPFTIAPRHDEQNLGNVTLNLQLVPQSTRTQEITVTAQRGLREAVQSISRVDVSAELVKKLPALAGETDVFRVLQLMPGIQTASELSSGLYVRGGTPDQNLTLLDGAIVYNPSHLGGFLSTFNGDAMRDIRLYKGSFPAEYGGRLSSVIDLTMKEGSTKGLHGLVSLGSLTARGLLEGPIASSSATFMLSGRRMVYDLILGLTSKLTGLDETLLPVYYFYDLNGKVNYKISDDDHIFLSGYLGRDGFRFSLNNFLGLGLQWGNATGNLRWMHVVSPAIFMNSSLIFTNYEYGVSYTVKTGLQDQTFATLSQIQDWTLRTDVQYTPDAAHSIKAGVEATLHTFRNLVQASGTDNPSSPNSNRINGLETALFVQDEWNATDNLAVNIGLRSSWFQAGGQFNLEPRVAGSLALSDDIKLNGSFSYLNQYLHLLSRNDVSLPSDIWLPATSAILPSNATQYVLGSEMQLFGGELSFSLEAYYKSMRNLYEYRDGTVLNTINVNTLEQDLTRGAGESYGIEALLERRVGKLSGWIGYTLSWATRTFPELNGGRTFAPRYDKRHNISLALTYKLNEKWEFGATWTYTSGQPITLPSGQADFPDLQGVQAIEPLKNKLTPAYNFTERNGARMPAYHRLDLSATYKTTVFGLACDYFVSVYNAYNQQNPFAWFISTTPSGGLFGASSAGFAKPTIQQLTLFPFFPSVGLSVRF